MPYVVVNAFKDTKDKGHFYERNKPYPREGYKPSEDRITALSEVHPIYKRVFIKEVDAEQVPEPKTDEPEILKLNADEVVKKINDGELNISELEALYEYEQKEKDRKTVKAALETQIKQQKEQEDKE